MADASLSQLWDGFASNTELKLEHPQGRGSGQLHKPSSFICILDSGGCGSELQWCACSIHPACKTLYILPVIRGIFFLFPWHFSSAGKGRTMARTWLFTFTSWCVHIITWLEELRRWEKHQMFLCPEIKPWDLAAVLLGVPGVGGEGTPKFLLMQVVILKRLSLIQPPNLSFHSEHSQILCHTMLSKGRHRAALLAPSRVPLGDGFVAEPTYTGQGRGWNLPWGLSYLLLYLSYGMKSTFAFQTPVAFMLKLKTVLLKEQMEVADCQQMAQSWVRASCSPAEWLSEVPLLRMRFSAAGPGQGVLGWEAA